jgi:hypothetical protein
MNTCHQWCINSIPVTTHDLPTFCNNWMQPDLYCMIHKKMLVLFTLHWIWSLRCHGYCCECYIDLLSWNFLHQMAYITWWHCQYWDNIVSVINEYGTVGGIRICRWNWSTWRNPAPMPLCPPQNTHDLTWDGTQATVGSRRLTAWAVAWRVMTLTSSKYENLIDLSMWQNSTYFLPNYECCEILIGT